MIEQTTKNLNETKSEKYNIAPDTLKKKSIEDENFKEIYDFHRLTKVKEDLERRECSNTNSDNRKKE